MLSKDRKILSQTHVLSNERISQCSWKYLRWLYDHIIGYSRVMKWTIIKKVPAEKNGMQYLKCYHNRKRCLMYDKVLNTPLQNIKEWHAQQLIVRGHPFSTYVKFFEELTFPTPDTHTCAYQGGGVGKKRWFTPFLMNNPFLTLAPNIV